MGIWSESPQVIKQGRQLSPFDDWCVWKVLSPIDANLGLMHTHRADQLPFNYNPTTILYLLADTVFHEIPSGAMSLCTWNTYSFVALSGIWKFLEAVLAWKVVVMKSFTTHSILLKASGESALTNWFSSLRPFAVLMSSLRLDKKSYHRPELQPGQRKGSRTILYNQMAK